MGEQLRGKSIKKLWANLNGKSTNNKICFGKT